MSGQTQDNTSRVTLNTHVSFELMLSLLTVQEVTFLQTPFSVHSRTWSPNLRVLGETLSRRSCHHPGGDNNTQDEGQTGDPRAHRQLQSGCGDVTVRWFMQNSSCIIIMPHNTCADIQNSPGTTPAGDFCINANANLTSGQDTENGVTGRKR
jgi:hypothetical protein